MKRQYACAGSRVRDKTHNVDQPYDLVEHVHAEDAAISSDPTAKLEARQDQKERETYAMKYSADWRVRMRTKLLP